jgi:hypothetical protein
LKKELAEITRKEVKTHEITFVLKKGGKKELEKSPADGDFGVR